MNHSFLNSCLLTALLCAGITSSPAAPEISNVRVSQRPGTTLVDVYYNLAGSTDSGASVSVELSDNSGASFGLPVTALSGHVGASITNGTNRHLIWNAKADRPDGYSATMRLRLTAVDTPPIPEGVTLIPAGTFTTGRTSGDLDSNAPPVTVSVSAFYIGKYKVTKAVWDEVNSSAAAYGYTDLTIGKGKAGDHPVHSITWFDMIKWCNARSQKNGLTPVYSVNGTVMKTGQSAPTADWNANGYRLPTETEWEKAARGGVTGKRFSTGTDTISHSQANYRSIIHSVDVSPTQGYHPKYSAGAEPFTSPVGSFAANGFGLYDMTGNVAQWCWDWFHQLSYVNGAADPKGIISGFTRSIRGGNWYANFIENRDCFRGSVAPTNSFSGFGFRLVRRAIP